MTEFATAPGFDDVWRPPVRSRRRTPETVLCPSGGPPADVRARLVRIVDRAPEVMVKVTGRTRDGDHLRAHLDYISRHAALEIDGSDGERLTSRQALAEVADNWAALSRADSRTRANSPLSLSVVLSMPKGADAIVVRDAARAWALAAFGERHDYVLALHTDACHPHVHVAVCARGLAGERLNPKKADLEAWRQLFAQALRDRGIQAEATPRRARGVTRKPERTVLRKMHERHQRGEGPPSRVRVSAYKTAAVVALAGCREPEPWERCLVERQGRVRGLYLAQAQLMQRSSHGPDRDLGFRLEAFVRALPSPDTQTLALARALRAAGRQPSPEPQKRPPERGR